MMVFDWNKAAFILREHNVANASAALRDDRFWTMCQILIDGKIPDTPEYQHLSSPWSIPELIIQKGRGGTEKGELSITCYKMVINTPGWNAKTFWPESARKILRESVDDGVF